MSKNIVINELTQNGYQELYPKTISSQIEDMDPLGSWKYAGKFTGFNEQNKIDINGLSGGVFAKFFNQILLKINNIQGGTSGINLGPLQLNFSIVSLTGTRRNMIISLISSQGSVQTFDKSVFLINKVGGCNSTVYYSPTVYENTGEFTKPYGIMSNLEIKEVFAYMTWIYNSYVTDFDADLYFR